ncbi:MAG: ribosome small subunit-dependent GTPase A [Bacteroidetes bacterium]|nr:ribosome small subunit-dependent GTPase A [Bacteroidota bacterium]
MKGRVIKSTGNWYIVLAHDGEKFNCRIKGRLKIDGYKSTNPIAVGDEVVFELEDNQLPSPEGEGQGVKSGVISAVEKRKNCIIRKSKNLSKQSHILATNVDQAMLIVTLAVPKTSFGFIDRFLATAEAYSIPVHIIFNKADIFEEDDLLKEDLMNVMSIYEKIGYKCYSVCSTKMKKEKKEKMISLLKDKITLLAGHSGVGKSTFINTIEPSLDLKTGNLSSAHMKGKHTTTFTEMHALSFGGFIIDTPGIKEFSVVNMDKYEISHFFPEIFRKADECKFHTCLHINEPKCAVIAAVAKEEIAPSRYHSYLSIMNGEEVIKEYND